jgi:hypothetical protein
VVRLCKVRFAYGVLRGNMGKRGKSSGAVILREGKGAWAMGEGIVACL